MEKQDVEKFFTTIINENKDVTPGVAAIRTLMMCIERDNSVTVQELSDKMRNAIKVMIRTDYPTTYYPVASATELFLRHITLMNLDNMPFSFCKDVMKTRGEDFLMMMTPARNKIARRAARYIHDGCRILCHSKSRVVLQAMKHAKDSGCKFQVFVTKSFPDSSGDEMCADLNAYGIPCSVILDSAVGYVMEQVDMVMVGAEGIVESGGIINKIGSFTMAMCAKEMKKPFYVLAESFKFLRVYPISQRDVPKEFKYVASTLDQDLDKDLDKEQPLVDYTPPFYIALLFTDLGILTPSAVSDELIKLYL